MFFQHIIIFSAAVLLISLSSDTLYAQDIHTALQDFEQGKIESAREAVMRLQDTAYNDPVYQFLSAVFEEDGERAYSLYSAISANYPDSPVFEHVLWRMCQYYYAKGVYDTCLESLDRFLETFPESPDRETARKLRGRITSIIKPDRRTESPVSPETVTLYTLQFGAFGTEEGAQRRVAYLENLGIAQSVIKKQKVGSRILYKIWVGEYTSREEAEQMRDAVRRRYKIRDIFVTQKR